MILFLVFLIVLPLLFGTAFRNEGEGIAASWAKGLPVLVASAYFPGVVCGFLQTSLRTFLIAWTAVVCAGIAAAAAVCIYRLRKGSFPARKRPRMPGLLEWMMVLLVLIQILIPLFFMHIDDDDATYVGMATVAVDTDTVYSYHPYTGDEIKGPLVKQPIIDTRRYLISPLYCFYAGVSEYTGIRPVVLCHTYLPPFFILAAYIAFYLIGKRLFEEPEKRAVFVIFVSALNICSYISVYLSGTFLLIRVWQGKGQFAGIAVPMILYTFLSLREHAVRKGKGPVTAEEKTDWRYLFFLMMYCMIATPMGNMLGVVMESMLGILLAVYKKRAGILVRTAICFILPFIAMVLYLVFLRV